MAGDKKTNLLNEKQKEAIENYLEARLGIYGVHSYGFKWEVTPKYSYSECATQEIKLKHCGILSHMLKACNLEIQVWGVEEMKTISVHFSYEHHGGGTNGHDANITLVSHPDGRIYEKEGRN